MTRTALPQGPLCPACGAEFPRAPRHVSARFRMHPPDLHLGHARGPSALIEAGVTASESKAVAACKANRADDRG